MRKKSAPAFLNARTPEEIAKRERIEEIRSRSRGRSISRKRDRRPRKVRNSTEQTVSKRKIEVKQAGPTLNTDMFSIQSLRKEILRVLTSPAAVPMIEYLGKDKERELKSSLFIVQMKREMAQSQKDVKFEDIEQLMLSKLKRMCEDMTGVPVAPPRPRTMTAGSQDFSREPVVNSDVTAQMRHMAEALVKKVYDEAEKGKLTFL